MQDKNETGQLTPKFPYFVKALDLTFNIMTIWMVSL